jgi:hypothetical protein
LTLGYATRLKIDDSFFDLLKVSFVLSAVFFVPISHTYLHNLALASVEKATSLACRGWREEMSKWCRSFF